MKDNIVNKPLEVKVYPNLLNPVSLDVSSLLTELICIINIIFHNVHTFTVNNSG